MKLYLNQASPYGRKVVVTAHEFGLGDMLQIVRVDPWTDPADFLRQAPLGRVPVLETGNGLVLTESTLICLHLAEEQGAWGAVPRKRADVLARMGVAEGLIDAGYLAFVERRRPETQRWGPWVERQTAAISRTIDAVAEPPADRFDLGDIGLACAIAYLDFRLSHIPWRNQRPDLARWLDHVSQRPSMLASEPA